MYQKNCINVKFSEGLGIFDNHYGYPEIDNGLTGKVFDIKEASDMTEIIEKRIKTLVAIVDTKHGDQK